LNSTLYKPPVLGILVILLFMCEKMLAHTYTGITIYVLPAPWSYIVPGVIGLLGVFMVIRGLGKDEVKGTMLGWGGAVLIWMSWFESGLHILAGYNNIDMVVPKEGNMMAGLLGEHVILQASGIFCVVTLFFVMLNKDVRCRMLLWIRRRIGLGTSIGVPAPGNRPNVARVAAFEYVFVTWFMYVLMLVIVDPRINGLYHPVTYTLNVIVGAWGVYLLWKLTQQRETGFTLRYGIGAVGVAWYIPECLALYEHLYEFYLRPDLHPIAMTFVLVAFVWIIRVLWKTPVDPETGRATLR